MEERGRAVVDALVRRDAGASQYFPQVSLAPTTGRRSIESRVESLWRVFPTISSLPEALSVWTSEVKDWMSSLALRLGRGRQLRQTAPRVRDRDTCPSG